MRPDEPLERALYECDWHAIIDGKDRGSGTFIGWYDGRYWTAVYGDGNWSPKYVTAFRRIEVRYV